MPENPPTPLREVVRAFGSWLLILIAVAAVGLVGVAVVLWGAIRVWSLIGE